MKDEIQALYSAQQRLNDATTPEAVFEALGDLLTWLITGSTASISRRGDPNLPDRLAALTSLAPQLSDDGRRLVLPLVAENEAHAILTLEALQALDLPDVALVSTLAALAASALARLAWPAPPAVFRQLVENANVAIDVADLGGVLRYANRAAAQLYGLESPDQLVGRNVSEVYFHDEERQIAGELIIKSEQSEGWIGEVAHRNVKGEMLPVRLAVFALRDPQNRRMNNFGAIIQNLSEQQRLLLSLRQQARRLRAAAEVARATISALDLESLFNQVASVTQSLFNFDRVSILLVERDALHIRVAYSGAPVTLQDPWLPLDERSLNGWVALNGKAALVNDVATDPHYLVIPDAPDVAAELTVPLRLGRQVIGTLDLQSVTRGIFQPEDLETFQSIADQLSVAVYNVQLFTAEQAKVRQLAALNEISRMLMATYNLDEVWHAIYKQTAQLFNISTFFISLLEPHTNMLRFIWLVDEGRVIRDVPPYPPTGLSGLVLRGGEPILLQDALAQADWLRGQGVEVITLPGTPPARSWLGVPLRARDGNVLGLINVQSYEPNTFSSADLHLLATIATQISLGLENAQHVTQLNAAAAQLEARARRLESLNRVGALISSSLDRNRILALTAEQVVRLLEVDHCLILLTDDAGQAAHLVAEHPVTELSAGVPLEGYSLTNALQSEGVASYPDAQSDSRLDGIRTVLQRLGTRSLLAIRLAVKDKTIGAIIVNAIQRARTFTAEEIETCRTLAAQVALAVENADLYARALVATELKSQFVATMSHELRTPLNAIIGYSEMILSGIYGAVSDTQKDRLQRVYSAGQHLLTMVEEVLDLSKIESGQIALNLEPLDVVPVILSALGAVAQQADAKLLRLGTEIPAEVPPVRADPERLRQVMVNLLSNAVKFTREGGVTVRVSTLSVRDGVCKGRPLPDVKLSDGDWLAIDVQDTGIGIAREHFEIIFEAFRQVDGTARREFGGTGLGLSVARQLVELHGGKLWLESELGRGSTFTVALPLDLPARTDHS